MMKKRNLGEMVAYFKRRVADMDIAQKYKMELLGMITAIEIKHDELAPKWIPVTEALPEDGSLVIACSPYGKITIVFFTKGISQEDRTKMKNGEIDDPSEETWCLSEGYSKSKRSDLIKEGDEWENNQKAYAWNYGPFHYSGQDFVAWMPLPEPAVIGDVTDESDR